MKGHISFILVLASAVLALGILGTALASHDFSLAGAIAAERMHGMQMNAKEMLLEGAWQGASGAFALYSSTHSKKACLGADPPKMCFRDDEAREAARLGAYAELLLLSASDFPDAEMSFWCGAPPSPGTARSHAGKMAASGMVSPVPGRSALAFPGCAGALSVSLQQNADPIENPSLSGVSFGESGSTVGVSLYSSGLEAAAVSYIPPGTEVKK